MGRFVQGCHRRIRRGLPALAAATGLLLVGVSAPPARAADSGGLVAQGEDSRSGEYIVRLEAPTRYHQTVGLAIVEPMAILGVFSTLSPVVAGPITFELRRKHPVLGDRQVTTPSELLATAEVLDGAGLGLADISSISCAGPNARLHFDVDTRRLSIDGSETFVAWALPILDQALYTSPLDVTLEGTPEKPQLHLRNRGAEAWLVTEVRLGEGKKQPLSRPISGRVKAVESGVSIVKEALNIGLDSTYDGFLPPGADRVFALNGPLTPGQAQAINLVAYRLTDPFVLSGLYLLPDKDKDGQVFRAAEPPWNQWKHSPMLVLGPWPPAIIILRQCHQPGSVAAR